MSEAFRTPLCPSLLTLGCALLVHPWAGAPLSRPISMELHDGNVFAYVMLAGLMWVLATLGCRFWRGGLYVSAATCFLCAALLVVVPATEPNSTVHNLAFGGIVLLSMALFFVWAMDTLDVTQALPVVLPMALGLPFHVSLGIGGVQLLLIGSLLVALNLTFGHVGRRERLTELSSR